MLAIIEQDCVSCFGSHNELAEAAAAAYVLKPRSTTCCITQSASRLTALMLADPYLNTDAGTMSPFEHGEVFVLDDGGEVSFGMSSAVRTAGSKGLCRPGTRDTPKHMHPVASCNAMQARTSVEQHTCARVDIRVFVPVLECACSPC